MGGDANDAADAQDTVTPDEAFAMIGHETRVQILEVLATTHRADRPVQFSEIRRQLGDIDSAHFNYHLDKLVGHFLEQTEAGYDFRRPGRRVAQAILSGSVLGNPISELTPVDQECHHCGGQLEVMYHRGRIAVYCTECPGIYERSNYQAEHDDVPDEYGFLGLHDLPPAGMGDRTPTEALEAAHRFTLADTLSVASDCCPRCGGTFDDRVDVCEDHDAADGCCDSCGYRHQVVYTAHCRNCTFDTRRPFGTMLVGATPLQSFVTDHGVNLSGADYETSSGVFMTFDEAVEETDPFEAVFTFAIDGDEIDLTVGEDLTVTSVSR
ncbi:winged helix-turn-helix domain-containing protein [Haloarchaeobius amylolyticus]|uniref:winged helix-turn-helix domain-containing protein n=1 Tax=Haloarchaeobius amylolyticus TaxID=1198296 RepID=UPI00226DFC3B|nr:winged helix-turn-helix domain-containing protein [Haloarchaeobius amylolyticus]